MGYCEELMIHDITIWEYVGLSIGMINKHGEKDYQQLGLGFMVDIGIMMLQPVKCGGRSGFMMECCLAQSFRIASHILHPKIYDALNKN